MKNLMILAVASLFLTPMSQASVYINCGKDGLNRQAMEFNTTVLELSSQDDDFTGSVGGNWTLKFPGQDWVDGGSLVVLPDGNAVAPKNIQAKMQEVSNGNTTVTIAVKLASAMGGAVGTKYVIDDIYSEETTLTEYIMGGFAGGTQLATYECVSAID